MFFVFFKKGKGVVGGVLCLWDLKSALSQSSIVVYFSIKGKN
jgi:hypothetical protein